jgi:phospholipid/cholesterol/gamma-HCH transport system ATP-binding protein
MTERSRRVTRSNDERSLRSQLAGLLRPRRKDRVNDPEGQFGAEKDVFPGNDACGIEARGVRKSFDGVDVLSGVDLCIAQGSITTILGPSGTGKSVLLRTLMGLLEPDDGEVFVFGENLWSLSVRERRERSVRMGVLFQDGGMLSSLNVYDNTALPLRTHSNLPEDQIRVIVMDRLTDVGLDEAVRKFPGELSGGMRKRAAFARALVLSPPIVFLDEPDSGLDPIRTNLLNELIVNLHGKHRSTYVIITHHIATARMVSDYIALLWRGRIVMHGTPDEVFASTDPFIQQFLTGDTAGPVGMK